MSHQDEDEIKFSNPIEEIANLRLKLKETQTEFLEFQESSRDLEKEYETHIQQLQQKNNKLATQIVRFEEENDQLRARNTAYTNDTQHKLNDYQQQIAELTSLNDRLSSYIRELEQSNDDLERAQRALAASLNDFEAKLNDQIERNVLLENEVGEKEDLQCTIQRLKEEVRDLRHELVVAKNCSDTAKQKLPVNSNMVISPTSRLSAMGIVNSLLKKIGVLESRLDASKKVTGC